MVIASYLITEKMFRYLFLVFNQIVPDAEYEQILKRFQVFQFPYFIMKQTQNLYFLQLFEVLYYLNLIEGQI